MRSVLALAVVTVAATAPALAQEAPAPAASSPAIVDEQVRRAQEAQAADRGRVKSMVDEAVRASDSAAPSPAQEAPNPPPAAATQIPAPPETITRDNPVPSAPPPPVPPPSAAPPPASPAAAAAAPASDTSTAVMAASQLIGQTVEDGGGTSLGTIRDLVIDQRNQVTQVMVAVGGVLGVGERVVAVDMSQLKAVGETASFYLDLTAQQAQQMPAYELRDGMWRLADTAATESVAPTGAPASGTGNP